MTVGILALHGDFAEHAAILRSLKVMHHEVRSRTDLKDCTHLIIPGGESTVISRFLQESGLSKDIQDRVKAGALAVYGTCAGAIVLSTKVTGKNAPKPLRLLDMTVERNAYGSQLQSFDALLKIKGFKTPVHAAFIRAPVITKVAKGVEVLASHGGHPVLVRNQSLLAGTFHPEVRSDSSIHRFFLEM